MKNILLSLFLFLTTLYLTAQAPSIEWQKSLGGSEFDAAYSIQQTTDGGYIVAGESYSTNGDVTGNHGDYDYWVVKLSTTGVIEWQKSLGGSGYDVGWNIQQTTDGGYIVIGYANSTDGDVMGNHGDFDYWVVKLSSTGSIEWQKSLGGSGEDRGYSIQQTTDGGYIVAGQSASTNGDVTGNHGGNDYWVVKLSSTGSIIWQKSLGGTGSDVGRSIQQTTDGGYIVAGTSNSIDGDVTGNHGDFDYWVVKLSSTGAIIWQKTLGGTGSDNAYSIRQTTDGGYVVAGTSNSNDGDVTGNHGDFDYWIVKLSSTGSIIWQKSLGGSGIDWATSSQQTTDGGYIVIGGSNSIDGDITASLGINDYWVVKLSSTGSITWQKSLGGSRNDVGWSIQQRTDGGFIIAGTSDSNDGDVTGNNGNSDYWVIKLSASVGVNEINVFNEFSVYPNPTSSQIKLKVKTDLIGAVYTIYDNMGKVVKSGKVKTENTIIELDDLSNGIYLLNVGGNSQQTFKVIKN